MPENGGTGSELAALLRTIVSGAESVPNSEKLTYYRAALNSLQDPVIRQAIEDLLLGYASAHALSDQDAPHVVVLIHGIRTRATWYEQLSSELESVPGVRAVPIRYGRLDLFKFILPPFFRRDPIAHLKTQLGLVARAHKGARISVVAHSFGTYAIARILDEDTALHIHRLVLCGSIIPPRFEWHRIAGKVDEQIINECATRDILPVLATTSSWGYGDSGTYGFDSTLVLDRFHALDHSGFQSKDFYSRWWLPLWKQPPSLQVPDTGNRPVSPWWFRVVELVPVKSLVFVAIVVLALRCSR